MGIPRFRACLVVSILAVGAFFLGSAQLAQAACPGNVAGCTLYLDASSSVYADAGTTAANDGQTVQQWNDLSGSGLHATQATSGERPTYRASVNGHPALQFGGGTRLSIGGNSDFTQSAFTAFVVFERTGNIGYQAVLNKGNATAEGTTWEIMASTNNNIVSFDTFYGGTNNGSTQYGGSTNWELVTAQRVSATSKFIYRNGILAAASSDAGNSLNAGQYPLTIGSSAAGTALPFAGYVRAVVYYPTSLSSSDRQTVERALINSYSVPGISLLDDLTFALTTFDHQHTTVGMYMYSTSDAVSFDSPSGVTNPIYISATSDNLASAIMFYQGKYWLAYENDAVPGSNYFSIARADTYGGPYTHYLDVTVRTGPVGAHFVWNPRWFVDDDDSIHINVNSGDCGVDCFQDSNGQPYILDALNADLTSWSTPTVVTGTFPNNMIDTLIISPANSPNGKYNIWYKNETTKYVEYMSSSSLKSGYTVTQSGDWAGWGSGKEGPILLKVGSTWRLYLDRFLAATGYAYTDSLDDWATWSVLTNVRTSIVSGTGSILLPTVTVMAPTASQTLTGTVDLQATATDFLTFDGVQFKVDGTTLAGAEDTSAPYTVAWDSTSVSDGTHTVTAVGRYGDTRTTTSHAVSVTIDNAPRGGSLSYLDGTTTATSVTLTVNDGTDAYPGIDTTSRTIQRRSAPLTGTTCGTYTSYQNQSVGGTYPSFSDTSLVADTCYQYRYLVADTNGHQATYTSLSTVKVQPTTSVGADTSATTSQTTSSSIDTRCTVEAPTSEAPLIFATRAVSDQEIELTFASWSARTSHFALEYGTRHGEYEYAVANIGNADTRQYLIKNLRPHTHYYFRIRPMNGCAPGTWSREVALSTLEPARLAPVARVIQAEPENVSPHPTEQMRAPETPSPSPTPNSGESTAATHRPWYLLVLGGMSGVALIIWVIRQLF